MSTGPVPYADPVLLARRALIDAARDLVEYVDGEGVANLDTACRAVGDYVDEWRGLVDPPARPTCTALPPLTWSVAELLGWLDSCRPDDIVEITASSISLGRR